MFTNSFVALILSEAFNLGHCDLLDLSSNPHQPCTVQSPGRGDESTNTGTDQNYDPVNVIDSIVDETVKTSVPSHHVNGAVNVNIINVYVDLGKHSTR